MIFDIVSFVIGLIQQVIDFVVQVINALIEALNVIFSALWDALVKAFNAVADLFGKIGTFFAKLWPDYIKPAIHGLVKHIKSVVDEIKIYAQIYADLLQKLYSLYQKYIYRWIKLVENILSTVRVVLSLFRILGAKWAAKLDADIARIQGYLAQFNQLIVGTLNGISTWLNFALDPFGIIRKDFFSATVFSSLGAIRRAVGFGGDRYLTASEAANTDGDRNMIAGGAAVLTRNADGSVTYSDASQRINAGYDTAWKEYGGTTGLP